jgi:hypothetical protein
MFHLSADDAGDKKLDKKPALDTGKIVVSGQLLKLLTSSQNQKNTLQRLVAKGSVNAASASQFGST